MATPRYLSATGGFVPEATGLAVAYVRDASKFKLNKYVQMVNSPVPVALYATLDPDFPVRMVSDAESRWEDGDDAPDGNHNIGNFKWDEVRIFRRAFPYALGEQALKTAKGWNPKAFHDAAMLSQAMTNRTYRVVNMLETSGNWPSNNTAAANTLNGGYGKWNLGSADSSSPNHLAIRRTILEAVRKVVLITNGMVQIEDMRLLLSPGAALAMSETDEINAYLKNNEFALDQVKGNKPGQNALWGLPSHYAGVELVVEDAVRVSSRPNAAGTPATVDTYKTFIKSDTSAVLLSRPGGLDGNYGSPSFSTAQVHFYKYEMAVESKYDDWHKKHRCRVVDQSREFLTAGASGFLITNII